MIPGMGGLNPKKMQAMMKQLGINQEDIDVERVIIEKTDGKKIIIEPAQVAKVNMQGNESWQITGDSREEESEPFNEEDIKQVMEKTGKDKDQVINALEKAQGDLAEAIIELS